MPRTEDKARLSGEEARGLIVPVVQGLSRRLIRAGRLMLSGRDGRLLLRMPQSRGTATKEVVTVPLMSPTLGDIVVSQGSTFVRFSPGTDGQVLTADSTVTAGIKWAAASGGGSTPAWRDSTYRQYRWNANLASLAMHGAGYGNMSTSGSGSGIIHATGGYMQRITTTGANNVSGCHISGASTNPIAEVQWKPRLEVRWRSYSDISDSAIFIGLYKNTGTVDNNLARSEYRAGISYVAGTDTHFQLDESDGTTRTKTSTGVTPAVDTAYSFILDWNNGTSAFDVTINGSSVGSMSTNLPASTADLGIFARCTTVSGGTVQGIQVAAITLQTL